MSTPSLTIVPSQQDQARPLSLVDTLSKKDRDRITNWALDSYKRCKDSRRSTERQWYMNMAFYRGKQNIALLNTAASTNGFRLYTPPAPPWRVRLVVNKVRSYIRTELAKICSNSPTFTVVPATGEDEDLIAARTSEKIFEAVYSNYSIKAVVREAEWWNTICGTAFIKNYWSPTKVDKYSKQKGDFVIEAVTPFHVFVPDLKQRHLEEQPYVIHATTKSVYWAKSTFPTFEGKDAKSIVGSANSNDILDDAFLNITDTGRSASDQVLVLEVWVKPGATSMFPDGSLLTIVGDTLVQITKKYPYDHGEFPFSKLEHVESGQFYGTSIVEDLIPLQKEYNRTRSQIIESKNTMAKPKLLAARGSINPNLITSEPGQAILYTPGFPAPTPLQLTPLPNYVLNEVQQLQQDMDDLAGQHEISRGSNPSQVTAATALSFLNEQDDTKLSGTIESLELGLEKLGRHILSHVSQFWTTPRIVRVVGKDSTFDAQQYKGSDLGGNLDVRVQSGSALPKSKAAKQAFVMDLLKMGLIPKEQGLEMLDIGGIEKVYEEYLVDLRQAQRENLRMANGEMDVTPNGWDNHQVHIEVHNKFRKGQQFEALSDEQKQLWEAHVQMHEQAITQKQTEDLQTQMAAMGQAPPPGDPTQGPPGASPAGPPMDAPPMDAQGVPPMLGGMV